MILIASKNCVLNIERLATAGLTLNKEGKTVLAVEFYDQSTFEFGGDDATELLEGIRLFAGRNTNATYQPSST